MGTTLVIEDQMDTEGIDTGVARHLWTRDEYYRLGETGLFDGRRIELIHGEIIDMAPMAVPHAVALANCQEILADISKRQFRLRVQLPLVAPGGSEVQPDLAVVERGSDLFEHPKTALLIVEISDTTLAYDRRVKAPLYAAAGVPEYWIVNLQTNQVEVRREPVSDAQLKTGYIYRSTTLFSAADTLVPLFASDATVRVADLLP